ncbi:MAG: MATE family efflux transporter [Eubacteriales bacterium]
MEYILPKEKRLDEIEDSKTVYKKYMEVAFPSAMQGLLLDLMLAIDLAMVGVLGAEALASVGIMSQPRMVLLVLVRSLSVPVTAMIARRKGEGKFAEMNSILKQAIVLTFLIYIPMISTALYFLPSIIELAGGKGDLIMSGALYGRYITVGLLFAAFTQIVSAALIGIGYTKIVFKANAIGNVTNTILNIFLIHGLLFFPRMEIAGAGLATLIGNIVTATIILITVLDKNHELTLRDASPWKFNKQTTRGFFKIGASSLGEQSFERFGMFTYTKMVAGLGVVQFATHQICMNLTDIFYSFSMGLGYASAAHTGQWLGRGRKDMAEAYGKIGLRVGICVAFIFFIIYIVGRSFLIDIYTNDERVIKLGSYIIIILAVASFPQVTQLVCSGVLKGAGDSFYVMLYSLFIIAIFRPILTYILCFKLNMGLYGAWIAVITDQSFRMLFSYFRFKRGIWKEIQI